MSDSDGPRLIDLSTGEEIERVSSKQASIMPSSAGDFDDEFDDEDETLSERLWGLTEMFPQKLRNLSRGMTDLSVGGIMFESERAQMEEQQLQQQRQIMLGPNAALSGQSGMMGGPPGMPAMPSVAPPQR